MFWTWSNSWIFYGCNYRYMFNLYSYRIQKEINSGGDCIEKLFYLSGGMGMFGKERFKDCNEWRENIKTRIELITDGRAKCCNPNDHFNFLDDYGYKSQKEIMNFELYKIRNSNALIVNFNDPKSIGTACEMAVASENRIPIFGLCENGEENIIHPWLKEFCERIFTDREELILYIIRHYVNNT